MLVDVGQRFPYQVVNGQRENAQIDGGDLAARIHPQLGDRALDRGLEPEPQLRGVGALAEAVHLFERKAELGVAVGRDNLETDLFVVADLDRVWVDLAVSPEDVPLVRIGQTLSVAVRGRTETAEGRVTFIGPMLDKDTRSARVIAEIDNQNGVWRPGSFVTAAIAVEQQSVPIAVPVAALGYRV